MSSNKVSGLGQGTANSPIDQYGRSTKRMDFIAVNISSSDIFTEQAPNTVLRISFFKN